MNSNLLQYYDPDAIQRHLALPDVSFEQHLKKKFLQTARIVNSRTSIYLDTNFWLNLRDVKLGKSLDDCWQCLLTKLEELVASKEVICPVSRHVFSELIKQTDETTKLVTAELINTLSLGTSLQPEHEIVYTELQYFLKTLLIESADVEDIQNLVWTSASNLLGVHMPVSEGFDEQTLLALQKAFLDFMWHVPFATMINMLGKPPQSVVSDWSETATTVNRLNELYSDSVKSYKKLQVDEFRGVLETYGDLIEEITEHLQGWKSHAFEKLGAPPSQIPNEPKELMVFLCSVYKKGNVGKNIPSLTIRSEIASAIRWNKGRQYEANDFHDIGHSIAAIPYCDAFATEKSLCHMLKQELKYEEKYSIKIVNSCGELLGVVANI